MLHGDSSVPLTYMVCEVLAVAGLSTTQQPYSQRRALLEELDVERRPVRLVPTFDDGAALFGAVVERGSPSRPILPAPVARHRCRGRRCLRLVAWCAFARGRA
jgi:hypothetical protein